MKGLLIDENLPPAYRTALVQRQPDVPVLEVGEEGAPPDGTLDPAILQWCEAHEFVLITNNRGSMPVHLIDHLSAGHHIPGIFTININAPIAQVVDDILTVAFASSAEEYLDTITYLPL